MHDADFAIRANQQVVCCLVCPKIGRCIARETRAVNHGPKCICVGTFVALRPGVLRQPKLPVDDFRSKHQQCRRLGHDPRSLTSGTCDLTSEASRNETSSFTPMFTSFVHSQVTTIYVYICIQNQVDLDICSCIHVHNHLVTSNVHIKLHVYMCMHSHIFEMHTPHFALHTQTFTWTDDNYVPFDPPRKDAINNLSKCVAGASARILNCL